MNEVDKLFQKTSHSAKVFAMWLDPEALPGTDEAFPWFSMVHTKKREGAKRKPDKYGRPRKPYIRRESWSPAGGAVEPTDYVDIPGETFSESTKRACRKAGKREIEREAGIIVPLEKFSERLSVHLPPVESDQEGSDFLETHCYLITLTEKKQHVPIVETDEVEKMDWFRMDQIPLPDPMIEKLATFRSHINNLEKLLTLNILRVKFEDADYWLKVYRARFRKYLDDE